MSSYSQKTVHPITGVVEMAQWLDDYFGPHRYGVRFPNGDIFKADDYKWEFEKDTTEANNKATFKK